MVTMVTVVWGAATGKDRLAVDVKERKVSW
jgi:hypothetical protein